MTTPPTRFPRHVADPQHVPTVLAVVVLVAFGVVTTVLGVNATRAAHPCPQIWRVVLDFGPAFVVVIALLLTARVLLLDAARAWVPPVAGSIGCILLVGLVSAHLHVA